MEAENMPPNERSKVKRTCSIWLQEIVSISLALFQPVLNFNTEQYSYAALKYELYESTNLC